MPESEYHQVDKRPLKFKSDSGKVSKKKKKDKKKKKEKIEITTKEISKKNEGVTPATVNYDHLTPAERKFKEAQEKQQMKRILKKATTTHRDRVEEFNRHLDSLSEHYDIPKVSWTK